MSLNTSIKILLVDNYTTTLRIVRTLLDEIGLKNVDEMTDASKAYDKLELLDRNKLDFIRVVSHELRTPMTIFAGYSQMLLKDGAALAGGDVLPLWLCFTVIIAFAALGMWMAYNAFQKSIK